ncbi:MAG: TolC family protein [Candidatus Glassbacteria bacterium]|nr:TolC family protein [Candidatus Glassbacteria bacterium]
MVSAYKYGFAPRRLFRPAALILLAALGTAGCTGVMRERLGSRTPAGPGVQWVPPPAAVTPAADTVSKTAGVPGEYLEDLRSLTLEQVVDIALGNNPETRASWAAARAAAAGLNSELGAYLPTLSASANVNRSSGSVAGGRFTYNQFVYGPSLSLSYLLFDFGKRGAEVESARQALYSRNWTHNATLQGVVLQVERAYFQYLYAKALFQAREVTLREAEENLEAAGQRQKAGLATVADVLQARTTRSQARLALQDVEGRLKTIRGALATAMGLDPDLEYDTGFLPDELPAEAVSQTVDQLLAEAESRRPDLAAARSSALEAEARVRSARADLFPSLSLSGSLGRDYFDSRDRYSDNKRAAISLEVPLFSGFSNEHEVLKAEAEADQARERVQSLKQKVMLDVWTSYYELKTASQRLETSRDLLASADESYQVSLERYKAGAGSILELLSVQAALEEARAQDVQARADWLLAIAQLAHDTGTLWSYDEKTGSPGAVQPEKENMK